MSIVETSTPTSVTTLAEQQSAANFAANARAIARSQPRLAEILPHALPSVEWLFARDRTLTARAADGCWWSGCSVPARAAKEMLRSFRPMGSVGCYIDPPHGAHLRAALAMTEANHAIVCVLRDAPSLRVMLGCDDFSADIDAGRLWFAWDDAWPAELRRLFDEQPGLPTPAQFIRLPVIPDDIANDVIAQGQRIFGEVTAARAEAIRAAHSSFVTTTAKHPPRICLAAPLNFRLWNDAGHALAEAMSADPSDLAAAVLNVDDPRHASPLALARAARDCDALLAANVARTQLPGVVSLNLPWVTWLTSGIIPTADPAAARDALILADAIWKTAALERGWRPAQIHVARWPGMSLGDASRGQGFALIADTRPLDPPTDRMEFSSHAVLWESIRDELLADPFALPIDDVARYLSKRMAVLQISEEAFDRALFIDRLILPAYQQGLADVLIKNGFPLRLYGAGWLELPKFRAHGDGPIASRDALRVAAGAAESLVHASLSNHHHPIDALDRPVLRRTGPTRESFLRAAREALSGKITSPPTAAELHPSLLREILG